MLTMREGGAMTHEIIKDYEKLVATAKMNKPESLAEAHVHWLFSVIERV